MVSVQIFKCGVRNVVLLDGSDLVVDSSRDRGRARLYLHEMDSVGGLADYVHLQVSAPPIALQDAVSA